MPEIFCCSQCGIDSDASFFRQGLCPLCYERVFLRCSRCGMAKRRISLFLLDKETLCFDCFTPFNPYDRSDHLDLSRFGAEQKFIGFELEYFAEVLPCIALLGDIHSDGSIRPEDDRIGVEFVSKPFPLDSLSSITSKVLYAIERTGADVNESCGFHVHFGISTYSKIELHRIKKWWLLFEPLFFNLIPVRRRTNDYTKRVNPETWDEDRYQALNIAARNKHGTYEVRLHHGTLNEEKIVGWIRFFAAFFDTFSQLPFGKRRLRTIYRMTPREQLLFIFQQTKCSLSIRKSIVRRARAYSPSLLEKAA